MTGFPAQTSTNEAQMKALSLNAITEIGKKGDSYMFSGFSILKYVRH